MGGGGEKGVGQTTDTDQKNSCYLTLQEFINIRSNCRHLSARKAISLFFGGGGGEA